MNAAVVPAPETYESLPGEHTLLPNTKILTSSELLPVARTLQCALRNATGWAFEIETAEFGTLTDPLLRSCICLVEEKADQSPENYRLDVDWWIVRIEATDPAGAFYGVQTLLQLLPAAVYQGVPRLDVSWVIPCVRIADAPRFRWRGAMLDSSRHFQPVAFIKKFINLLAVHKLNVFHWHLSDDQGWRIEIKKYPRLTDIGGQRPESPRGHFAQFLGGDGVPVSGFYTQEEIRDIVAYAAERHVRIVPEIEMPGHAQAAIAAYPQLGCTGEDPGVSTTWGIHEYLFNPNETTIRFLQDVLDETIALFPGCHIHIGGDEVKKTQWENTPSVRARIQEIGLKDASELQNWFIGRMASHLSRNGRQLVGWDEILEGGVPAGATVMSWRGVEGGIAAANAGHDAVMTPKEFTYFDYYQSLDTGDEPLAIGGHVPIDTVYSYEPVSEDVLPENASRILGVQAQIWTEYMPTLDLVEYMTFPRLCALAEVAWSPSKSRDFGGFKNRLSRHLDRLDLLGVKYRPLRDKAS